MTTHTDHELDYWGEVFNTQGYARYMSFEQFMEAPEFHEARIERGTMRPLLRAQQRVADAVQRGAAC